MEWTAGAESKLGEETVSSLCQPPANVVGSEKEEEEEKEEKKEMKMG